MARKPKYLAGKRNEISHRDLEVIRRYLAYWIKTCSDSKAKSDMMHKLSLDSIQWRESAAYYNHALAYLRQMQAWLTRSAYYEPVPEDWTPEEESST